MKVLSSNIHLFCPRSILFVATIALSLVATQTHAHTFMHAACSAAPDSLRNDSLVCDSILLDHLLPWPQNITTDLDRLMQSELLTRSQCAVLIYDLDGDSVIYDRGAQQLMRPASVLKLLTATTALNNLGGAHTFQTKLLHDGTVVDSVLVGNLYIKGGFDPMFGIDDMHAFIEALKIKGIAKIEGNIYADISFKDTLKWGEGWCWDDKEQTLTPLLYEARDTFMPEFMQALTQAGIAHPATYTAAIAYEGILTLLQQRSHTIDQVLMRMIKASDNLYAESMFYQLGALDNMPYASARLSAQKEYDLLGAIGLNPADYDIADGSGLSLYNHLTPQAVVAILRYAWQRNNIFNHLYHSLPIAGYDGTLRNHLKNTPAQGNVRAKTGTLRHVATLAGYATAANGTHLAFCIFNQGLKTSQEGRAFQDKVCLQLVR